MNVFDRIYEQHLWSGSESRSGKGAGQVARDLLAPAVSALVMDLGVRTVLDAGCGDGYWMPPLPGYIGLDVSAQAIALSRERHPDRVYVHDIGGPLPQCELVISRCVMQHMSLSDGVAHLVRIRESGARWLLATTYLRGKNMDMAPEGIAAGGGYWPDLQRPPFSMGLIVRSIPDGQTDDYDMGCLLALWAL